MQSVNDGHHVSAALLHVATAIHDGHFTTTSPQQTFDKFAADVYGTFARNLSASVVNFWSSSIITAFGFRLPHAGKMIIRHPLTFVGILQLL